MTWNWPKPKVQQLAQKSKGFNEEAKLLANPPASTMNQFPGEVRNAAVNYGKEVVSNVNSLRQSANNNLSMPDLQPKLDAQNELRQANPQEFKAQQRAAQAAKELQFKIDRIHQLQQQLQSQ
jgi:hypothetical protein